MRETSFMFSFASGLASPVMTQEKVSSPVTLRQTSAEP